VIGSGHRGGMSLAAGCPRCSTPVARHGTDGRYSCPEHGVVRPLWRPVVPSYDGFVDLLALAESFPTHLPWPLGPGWQVTDFAVVPGAATAVSLAGTSEQDGPVEITVVTEESGVGLGPRIARTGEPGPEIGEGPPSARVKVEGMPVQLWPMSLFPVDTGEQAGEWDRSVLVGEAGGRWLWLVLRPASAVLLVGGASPSEWILRDAARLGMALIELPFGDAGSTW